MLRTENKMVARRFVMMLLMTFGLFLTGTMTARADQLFDCEMKGRWVEANEDFIFNAVYISKNGPDTFTGTFSNPRARATANVSGYASSGIWNLKFNYTDPDHPEWVKELVGTGTKDSRHILTVKGNVNLKKRGALAGLGTFILTGSCKAK